MKGPEFVAEFEALTPEFAVASELIRARTRAGMTQEEVAAKMPVTQSRIAKMEGGINISIDALKRYAEATGTTLTISSPVIFSQALVLLALWRFWQYRFSQGSGDLAAEPCYFARAFEGGIPLPPRSW